MRITSFLSGLILSVLAFQCFAQKPLVLGIHPYLDKDEIINRFTPFVRYLENAINIPVELKVANNYKQHIDYIGNNNVDIAYMGPSSYVDMVKQYGHKPLIARLEVNGEPHFRGKIFVRNESQISNLHDLPGKDMVFGSDNSTMGFIVPAWTLQNENIHLSQLNSFHNLNNHTNIAYSVLMGEFDAGATTEEVFYAFKNRGLKEIGTTLAISEHLFVANNYLPKTLLTRIQNAFFKLNRHHLGKQIMSNIKHNITGLVSVNDSDYDNLRTIERQLKESTSP